jgi:hypothetical protein
VVHHPRERFQSAPKPEQHGSRALDVNGRFDALSAVSWNARAGVPSIEIKLTIKLAVSRNGALQQCASGQEKSPPGSSAFGKRHRRQGTTNKPAENALRVRDIHFQVSV